MRCRSPSCSSTSRGWLATTPSILRVAGYHPSLCRSPSSSSTSSRKERGGAGWAPLGIPRGPGPYIYAIGSHVVHTRRARGSSVGSNGGRGPLYEMGSGRRSESRLALECRVCVFYISDPVCEPSASAWRVAAGPVDVRCLPPPATHTSAEPGARWRQDGRRAEPRARRDAQRDAEHRRHAGRRSPAERRRRARRADRRPPARAGRNAAEPRAGRSEAAAAAAGGGRAADDAARAAGARATAARRPRAAAPGVLASHTHPGCGGGQRAVRWL